MVRDRQAEGRDRKAEGRDRKMEGREKEGMGKRGREEWRTGVRERFQPLSLWFFSSVNYTATV